MTLLFLVMFGFTVYSATERLMDKSNPEVQVSTKASHIAPEMDLYKEDMSITVGGTIDLMVIKADDLPRYVTVLATVGLIQKSDSTV